MNEIEYIREACIKGNPIVPANPSGAGCLHAGSDPNSYDRDFVGALEFWTCRNCGVREPFSMFYLAGSYHAREIRLADVLLAIGEKYAVDGSGMLLKRQFGTSAYDCAGMPGGWNLRADDLTQQSPECIDFLYELLNASH